MGGCHSLSGSTWWLLHLAVEKPRVFDDCYHRVCIKCPHFGKISRGYKDWTIRHDSSPKSPPGISLPVNVPVHKQENNQLLSIDQVHKLRSCLQIDIHQFTFVQSQISVNEARNEVTV